MSYILMPRNFRGWETLANKDAGYGPYFSARLRQRINDKKATNIVVTGEPGTGKSYLGIDICRVIAGLMKSGDDRFKLDQVVFTYRDYMKLVINLKLGKPILFDEPSYAMGKREWYKELNQALVKTIESQRFKVHPLLIPIINKALLDKTIRTYLIQYQIHVLDRGLAVVYRLRPSQHVDKVYRYTVCNLEYNMFDWDQCKRDSCLDCPRLVPQDPKQQCALFRARYERKKATIQDMRYSDALDQAAKTESAQVTDEQAEKMLYEYRERFTDENGRIDARAMRLIALRECELKLGLNRAYSIAKALKYDYPKDFPG